MDEMLQALKLMDKARALDPAGEGSLPVEVGVDGVDISRLLADVRGLVDA